MMRSGRCICVMTQATVWNCGTESCHLPLKGDRPDWYDSSLHEVHLVNDCTGSANATVFCACWYTGSTKSQYAV